MPTYWSHVAMRLITGASAAGGFTIGFVISKQRIIDFVIREQGRIGFIIRKQRRIGFIIREQRTIGFVIRKQRRIGFVIHKQRGQKRVERQTCKIWVGREGERSPMRSLNALSVPDDETKRKSFKKEF